MDGLHHYSMRQWLGARGGGNAPDGGKLHPWVKSNYHQELACVCGKLPLRSEVPAIMEALKETARVRALKLEPEGAEQGKLL